MTYIYLIDASFKSISQTCPDKRELLEAAKVNAMKILGMDKLELPKSVTPMLSEQMESKWESEPETKTRVRQYPEKTPSQVGARKRWLPSL